MGSNSKKGDKRPNVVDIVSSNETSKKAKTSTPNRTKNKKKENDIISSLPEISLRPKRASTGSSMYDRLKRRGKDEDNAAKEGETNPKMNNNPSNASDKSKTAKKIEIKSKCNKKKG